MDDPYAVSQAYDHPALVVSHQQPDAHPPVATPSPPYAYASPTSATFASLPPPPRPPFYSQDSYATNSSSGGTSSSSGSGSRSALSSTPSDSLFYHQQQQQPAYDAYSAPTPFVPPHASTSTSTSPAAAHAFVPTPVPTPPAGPTGASYLLQQHQANQQAFRRSQAATAPLVFGKYGAAAAAAGCAPDSPSSTTSDATATSTSTSTSKAQGSSASRHPGAGAGAGSGSGSEGDFSQTFYDPFKVKHRRRTSAQQLKVLEHHFEINSKPDLAMRKVLSEQLEMTPREVQVWFQNRRAKVKKLKERAEREAALSAATAATTATAHSAAASSSDAYLSDRSPVFQPLPLPPPPHQARTIYGSDVAAARRGSSPALFSGLTASSSLPLVSDSAGGFVPSPMSQPFLPLPLPPPPPPNAFVGGSVSAAYPSPVSLTSSPNDYASQPAATQGGYLDACASSSQAQAGAGRRFSLPAYNNDINAYSPLPAPPSHSSYAPTDATMPTTTAATYYPAIPLRPPSSAAVAAEASDPPLSPTSSLGGEQLATSQAQADAGGWAHEAVYAGPPLTQQSAWSMSDAAEAEHAYPPPPPTRREPSNASSLPPIAEHLHHHHTHG